MKLNDLRKLAIRRNSRILFRLAGGGECCVNEHGVAQVPGLKAVPDFSLEDQLAQAREFVMEPAANPKGAGREKLAREQMMVLAGAAPETAEEHEE